MNYFHFTFDRILTIIYLLITYFNIRILIVFESLTQLKGYNYNILLGGLKWKVKKLKQNYPFLRAKKL